MPVAFDLLYFVPTEGVCAQPYCEVLKTLHILLSFFFKIFQADRILYSVITVSTIDNASFE